MVRTKDYDERTDGYRVWLSADELDTFLDENIEASPEYQDTLVGESAVRARLVCWGVVGR
mgnify:CR=1 FL=1